MILTIFITFPKIKLTHGHIPEYTLWIRFESDRSKARKGKSKWCVTKKPLISLTLTVTRNSGGASEAIGM